MGQYLQLLSSVCKWAAGCVSLFSVVGCGGAVPWCLVLSYWIFHVGAIEVISDTLYYYIPLLIPLVVER